MDFVCVIFCVCGDVIDIFLVEFDFEVICVELFDDEVESFLVFDLFIGEVICKLLCFIFYFKSYYVILCEMLLEVVDQIKVEFKECLDYLCNNNKLVEVQCLEQCICFDLEMIFELGYCNGIENYLCYFFGWVFGELLLMFYDYLLVNLLLVIDELYVSVLQVGVMFKGDCLCKEILVEYGFCLFLVLDNWLLCFEEWEVVSLQIIFVFVILGFYEVEYVGWVIEQVVCFIGLVDLEIEVCLVMIQVDDLFLQICQCVVKDEWVLVIILIKCMVEDFIDYFGDYDVWVCYLYLDIDIVE